MIRLDTGSEAPLEVVSIEKVTKQVVAGFKYVVTGLFKIKDEQKKCSVEIWHRGWIKGEEGTQLQADCEDGKKFTTKTRSKRSAHHHRPMPDHMDDHHHHRDRHHHNVEVEHTKEVKANIMFENFISKYNRRYLNDQEHKMRMRIFKRNLHKIENLNKHEQGTAKYGITQFSDLTEKEYLHKTGLLVPERYENDLGNPLAHIPDIKDGDLPTQFDWRDKNAVTGVKNQGK